jgi:3-hydroxypropanoate dehydrogenase
MTERPDIAHPGALPGASLDQMFRTARTYNAFEGGSIARAVIEQIYDIAKWGPTASNCNPGRFVFLTTPESRARLSPYLSSANRAKSLAAPVNVLIAYDLDFAEKIPELFPHKPEAKHWFKDPALAKETAFRNATLQGAYLMLAARALGLDCGPMSGFNAQAVNDDFFAGTNWRVNFICNLGHGVQENLFPRLPRLSFEDACVVL